MEQEVKTTATFEQVEPSEPVVDSALETSSASVENATAESSFELEASEPQASTPVEEPVLDFEKKEEEKEKEDVEDKEDPDDNDGEDDDDDKEKKYSLLEQQYTELQTQYNNLKTSYDELVVFKNNIDNERKDALIAEFYMLSEEDKKDVIENKTKYTLDEIKAKLAVICYEKKVNFSSSADEKESVKQEEKPEEAITTFTYTEEEINLPDWVKAVKNNIGNDN